MAGVSISNPVVQGMDGVAFTGTRDGVEWRFLVHREGLEDLEYDYYETAEALLQAFHRHRGHIAKVAAKAIDDGHGGAATLVLQSLLL